MNCAGTMGYLYSGVGVGTFDPYLTPDPQLIQNGSPIQM